MYLIYSLTVLKSFKAQLMKLEGGLLENVG